MPKRKQQRTKKGSVAIWLRNSMITLRWSYQGKRYHLPLGMKDSTEARYLASLKIADIQHDMAHGCFDETLAKYRGQATDTPAPLTTVDLFTQFTESRRRDGTSGQRIAAVYQPMLSNLQRYGQNIEDETHAREFVDLLRSRQSSGTANQNLTMLKGFGKWCIDQGIWNTNHFAPIQCAKGSWDRQKRKAFTRDEINQILTTLRDDQYYGYYYDFVYTFFSLGARPSEVIGLQWKHVDLAQGKVTICTSLARSDDGKSAGYARKRKGTKTGSVRTLDLNSRMVELFTARWSLGAKPDDLVFPAKSGKPIDDHAFSQRAWKQTLRKAGVEHRPPYAIRHTTLSHGLEYGGWTLPQAAQVAGHSNNETVMKNYAHVIDPPKPLEF